MIVNQRLDLDARLGRTNVLLSTELSKCLPIVEQELHDLDVELALLLARRAQVATLVDRCKTGSSSHKKKIACRTYSEDLFILCIQC